MNTAVRGLEFAINQYQQLLAQRPLVAKGRGAVPGGLEPAADHAGPGPCGGQRHTVRGRAALLLKQQLDQLDAGIDKVYNTICELTGYDVTAAHPEIGPVPTDPSVIASIDVAADKEKAAINNYDMITMRRTGGAQSEGWRSA